jgi:hypothetical protein
MKRLACTYGASLKMAYRYRNRIHPRQFLLFRRNDFFKQSGRDFLSQSDALVRRYHPYADLTVDCTAGHFEDSVERIAGDLKKFRA